MSCSNESASSEEKKRSPAEAAEENSKKMRSSSENPTPPLSFTIIESRAPKGGKIYTHEDAARDFRRDALTREILGKLSEDQIFDLESFPLGWSWCIMDIDSNLTTFTQLANMAITKHNNANDSTYLLTKIVKAIGAPPGLAAYLIYGAKDKDGTTLTFKTKFTMSGTDGNYFIQYTSCSK